MNPNHLTTEFQHDNGNRSLVEFWSTHIIIPLHLRITSYEANLEFRQFPTIHFIGQSGGEDWVDHPHDAPMRGVKGRVSMLSDGNVRWSMVGVTLVGIIAPII